MFKAFSLIFSLCSHSPKISLDLVLRMVSSKMQILSPGPFPFLIENICSLLQPFHYGQLASAWKTLPISPASCFILTLKQSQYQTSNTVGFCCSHSFPLPTVCMWACLNPGHLWCQPCGYPLQEASTWIRSHVSVCPHGTPQT